MLDLEKYFDLISVFKYVVAKSHHELPYKYQVGKDIDIYVTQEDFKDLVEVTKIFVADMGYDIRIIEKSNRILIRLEENRKLHFQFDISVDSRNLIKGCMQHRNFFVLNSTNEKMIRTEELSKYPYKTWHQDWLDKYV